jgi:hypothetical protein
MKLTRNNTVVFVGMNADQIPARIVGRTAAPLTAEQTAEATAIVAILASNAFAASSETFNDKNIMATDGTVAGVENASTLARKAGAAVVYRLGRAGQVAPDGKEFGCTVWLDKGVAHYAITLRDKTVRTPEQIAASAAKRAENKANKVAATTTTTSDGRTA